MLSYHNNPEIKAAHIAQAEHHLAADMLRAGTFGERSGEKFKGCSVGCFAHEIDPNRGDYHAVVAEAAGWPEWLVYFNDTLFEGLPEGEREDFHVELRKRVPVGVDLTPVLHAIAIARMDRLIAAQDAAPDAPYKTEVLAALRQVRAYHEAPTESAAWSAESAAWSAAWSAARSAESAARSAESAARSAAESAARSAAWSAARSAAWSAARSAESAARSAAWSAARSAESAARSAEYRAERDALYAALAAVSP